VLLLSQADSAGIKVTPEEWQGLQARYRSQLDTLRADMGLDEGSLGDSSAAAADRSKLAALKVEQYFDRLIAGKTRLRPIPSTLATLLRERSSYRINNTGLNQAIELAQAASKQADSTKAATGPLQRAPGPAPIPGVSPGATPRPQITPAPGTAPAPRPAPPDTARPKAGN
jgi:hypothetical protein